METSIRVAVVEDDRATRDGLSLLIGGTPGFCTVGAYRSVEEALRALAGAAPDVLLLDVHLPGMRGSEGVAEFLARRPDLVVLMLTVYEGQDLVFESICNGARGYLLKTTPPGRLLDAIREAHGGGAPMSPAIARQVLGAFRSTPRPADAATDSLTEQEIRLLALLTEGLSYRLCGERLGITINTVRNHIRSIYDKLHVHSRSAAVARGLRGGLV